jgi:hypothetical protein
MDDVFLNYMAADKVQWRVDVNIIMNLSAYIKAGSFFVDRATAALRISLVWDVSNWVSDP